MRAPSGVSVRRDTSDVLLTFPNAAIPEDLTVPDVAVRSVVSSDLRNPFGLGCDKMLAYFHSQHRYSVGLRRPMPHPILEVPPDVAGARGFQNSDWALVGTHGGWVSGTLEGGCRYPAGLGLCAAWVPDRRAGGRALWHPRRKRRRHEPSHRHPRLRFDRRLDSASKRMLRDRQLRWDRKFCGGACDRSMGSKMANRVSRPSPLLPGSQGPREGHNGRRSR